MDLSAFSKDNFDAEEWLNATLELPEAQENKEEFAISLLAKLQSLSQEVSLSLQKTAEEVIQNMPRVAREVECMRQEALSLQQQMSAVKEDVMKVERDSSESMRTLLKIDNVKSCMQEASKALREADNWSTLSADVDEVFAQGDINTISAKLIGMQNSLEILVDVPDYQERSQRLELLKDRLEAVISPQLIAAFNAQTNDVAMVYMKIFKDIKRLPHLRKYYHNFQKGQLLQQWKQVIESEAEDTLMDWLNGFYDILLSTWHSQMSMCNQLLGDMSAIEVLSELLVDTLSSMEPSLEFCIEAALKQQTDRIQFLIELKQITDRLAKSLDLSIQSIDSSFLKNVHVVVLAQTIYGLYRPHIEQYAVLEERQLISSLDSVKFESSELTDSVRLLGESVSKVFYFVQEADDRCHSLTHGCAYTSLFQALRNFFEDYLNKFKTVKQLLRKNISGNENKLGNDWTTFQQSLHAMQICGEVLLQLQRLEQLLKSNLQEISRKLSYYAVSEDDLEKSRNPFHAYDDILLSRTMKRDLQLWITNLQEDADFAPLGDVTQFYKKMCSDIGSVVMDSIMEQINLHFQNVPLMKTWTDESDGTVLTEVPSFSLSPQEYITEVGQFLMTIPQHIEPFVLHDNAALYVALSNFKPSSAQENTGISAVILEFLAHGILHAYAEAILKIHYITPFSTTQLITDIEYVCDVLDDIGLTPPAEVENLVTLLKAKSSKYAVMSAGKPQRIVKAVKSMRKIR